MLILRIRQAETALDAGRLDEAYDLAKDDELRSHRRGQDLVSRLVAALVERGREHLAGERWQQALADAQKAFRLGGNRPEVAQLQASVAEILTSRQQAQQRKVDVLAEAQRRIRDGQLTLAEGLLADVNSDSGRAGALQREAAVRRAGLEPALAQAQASLDRQDWDGAIRGVMDARQLQAGHPQVAPLAAKVSQAALAQVRELLDQGRIDRASILVERLRPLTGETVDLEELSRVIALCRRAAEHVSRNQPREAEQVLRQLSAVLPRAAWLDAAIAAARQASQALEDLRTGPLGLVLAIGAGLSERTEPLPPTQVDRDDLTRRIPVVAAMREQAGAGVPERFLLHVDGIGSYLVVRKGQVTIGASRSDTCDVSLLAESGLSGVTIERAEEDYFLRATQAVLVNDRPVTQKLLADGDRIALSTRCRMRFGLPNAASTSAVLQLSGTRLPKTDARRVILLDRELILGPGSASHIRSDELAQPVVLYVRDGALCCRSSEPVRVNDQPHDGSAGLPLGSSVRIGPVSMVVTKV